MNQSKSSIAQAAEQVIESNHVFLEALLLRNFDVLARCWEHSERTVCVHAGKPPLRGWTEIASSWSERLAVHKDNLATVSVNDVSVVVAGDTAWVTGDIDMVVGENAYASATTNIFARHGERWLMVAHHASRVTNPQTHEA